ncbi:MAG: sigma-70 family RNA polymerase sigma factor [Phycisphaerales bacterium]
MADTTAQTEVTRVLRAIAGGNPRASEELLPLVYDELRRLAASRMAQEPAGHTLQPTALVHEAYLRLVKEEDVAWQGRGHFFAAAAEAMRRILIERARRRGRIKHGGEHRHVSVEEFEPGGSGGDAEGLDLLALDEALERLRGEDERLGRVVTLRFFGGLSVEQSAEVLGVSERTVKRDWEFARAWLFKEMTGQTRGAGGGS